MPIGRRKRAIRWIQLLGEHNQAVVSGDRDHKFVTPEMIDYVWVAELGEGFK